MKDPWSGRFVRPMTDPSIRYEVTYIEHSAYGARAILRNSRGEHTVAALVTLIMDPDQTTPVWPPPEPIPDDPPPQPLYVVAAPGSAERDLGTNQYSIGGHCPAMNYSAAVAYVRAKNLGLVIYQVERRQRPDGRWTVIGEIPVPPTEDRKRWFAVVHPMEIQGRGGRPMIRAAIPIFTNAEICRQFGAIGPTAPVVYEVERTAADGWRHVLNGPIKPTT